MSRTSHVGWTKKCPNPQPEIWHTWRNIHEKKAMRVFSYRATSKNTPLEVVWKMLVGLEVAAEFQGEQSGDRLIDAGEIQLPPKYDLPILQWKLRYIWNWKTWNFPLPSISRIWGEIPAAIPTNFLHHLYPDNPCIQSGSSSTRNLVQIKKGGFF